MNSDYYQWINTDTADPRRRRLPINSQLDPLKTLEIAEKLHVEENNESNYITFDMWWQVILCIIIMIFVGTVGLSLKNSNLGSLTHPKNYHGLSCGWDASVKNYKYLYYPINPSSGKKMTLMSERGMCVAKCPNLDDVKAKGFIRISHASGMNLNENGAFMTLLTPIRSPVYASSALHSYCIPEDSELRKQIFNIFNNDRHGFLLTLAQTIQKTWLLLFLTIFLSIISGYFLRKLLLTYPFSTMQSSLYTALCVSLCFCAKEVFSKNYISALVTLIWSCNILYKIFHDTAYLTESSLLYSHFRHILASFSSLDVLTSLIQLIVALAISMTLFLYCLVQSSTVDITKPHDVSLDANGGIGLLPLQRKLEYTSYTTIFRSSVIVFCMFWFISLITTGYSFVVAFVVADHYFPDNNDEDDSSVSHGIMFAFDRVGAVASTCALILVGKIGDVVKKFSFWGRRIAKMATIGTIIEMVLHDYDSIVAAKKTLIKLDNPIRSSVFDAIQLPYYAVNCINILTMTTSFVSSYLILKTIGRIDLGGIFNSSPTTMSFIIAIISTSIVRISIIDLSRAIGSLIYCFLIEEELSPNMIIADEQYSGAVSNYMKYFRDSKF